MDINEIPYPYIYPKEDSGIIVKRIKGQNNNYFEVRVSDPIWIEKIYENIDDKSIIAKIGFSYLHMDNRKYILAKREDFLNVQNVVKFQREGLDVMHTNVKDVVAHLRNEETIASRVYQHSKLGFDWYESKIIYKHYKTIGAKICSSYCGNFAIKPKGSIGEWYKMFSAEVLGQPPLELICILSLSAVVNAYIGEDIGLDSIICHLTGNSTTGKSTAMKLGISMFGYPDVKKNGLFTTYNSTANALLKALAGIKGIPIAFDEISMSNKRDFENLVYRLANGVDKSRLNKNSELREKDTWLTTILSNGEEPILQNSSNSGLYNRVFEFDNITWTKDAENAENITKVILKNYGHVGVKFAEFVMNKGKDEISKMYKERIQELKVLFEKRKVKDAFTDRRIKKHAIFLATVYLFEEMSGLELSKSKIIDLLALVEKASIENRNFDQTAIEYICNFISINIDKFNVYNKPASLGESHFAKGEVWGNITISEGKTEIEVNPLILEEKLNKGGFKSLKVVLKELRDKGFLDHEKDKLYRKRKNNLGKLAKVYVIVVKNDDEDSRFDPINNLLETITDTQRRRLLIKEKQRMKEMDGQSV